MSSEPDLDTYSLRKADVAEVAAPDLPYQPPTPREYKPRIAIVGAGAIAPAHLDAYRAAGWEVAAICNRTASKAQALAEQCYPDAQVTDDLPSVLADDTIDVVDITPYPEVRGPMIEAALQAGKHVLSQKPFVLDLDEGARLADLADAQGVKLAVNQNGRWSPHMAWMRAAVQAGLVGEVLSCHTSAHWDHTWVAGTEFDRIEDLVLYDFGIHWFDFVASIMPGRAQSVFATATRTGDQLAKQALLAQAQIAMIGGQASLVFDGATLHGPRDTTNIVGTLGSLRSEGPDLGQQTVTLTTAEGRCSPVLRGTWFNDGFRGTMGALLVAIEDGTEPANGARANLDSLALAFAAIASRRSGTLVKVGTVRRL